MGQRDFKGKSLIEFPDEYVCFDVETTGLNFEYDKIIEIAAVHVKYGAIFKTFSSLVQPRNSPNGVYISSFITDLTGITNEMLANAPTPDVVFPSFFEFVGDNLLVGHNVQFDINFAYDACEQCGLLLKNDFIDTMRISRKFLPNLHHHRLCDIVEYFSIQQDTAHRAEADAVATMQCYEKLKSGILEAMTFENFQKSFLDYSNSRSRDYSNRLKMVEATVTDIDETNPIYNKVIVFTGALYNMTRKEAFQVVKNLGGKPELNLTKKTYILVVGRGKIHDWEKPKEIEMNINNTNQKSAKVKKAESYQKEGLDIMIISEDTFFEMIEYQPKHLLRKA